MKVKKKTPESRVKVLPCAACIIISAIISLSLSLSLIIIIIKFAPPFVSMFSAGRVFFFTSRFLNPPFISCIQ